MIKIKIKDTRSCSIKTYGERVRKGDNRIASLLIEMPECFGEYNRGSCSVAMKCHVTEGVITYNLRTDSSTASVPITTDITDRKQVVRIDFVITHSGNVIGTTNTVKLDVLDAPDNGEPLTPRAEFDEVIAEQRETIAEQAETITAQTETIGAQGERITELNGEVTELTTENTRLETLTETQRETIQNMLDNPPQPQLYTPPVVTPSGSVQQISPPAGYDGLTNTVVDRVTAEVDSDIQPENIREGVDILGVEGTYNPFPEHSYGGIYYTELGEGGYPKKILIKDMLKSASTIPLFFNTFVDAKRELREVVFENCPEFLTLTQNIFQGFNYLTKVILPNSLTSISQNAFYGCTSLTEINLPDSLTSISQNAFSGCSRLTDINLPDSLTSIGSNAFYGCIRLTDINLPDSLTSIGGVAFYGCTSLTEINLPDSLTSIGSNAFYGCIRLTDLTLAQGFNCNGLNVSDSTRFTAETIVSCLEALADRTGQTAYTITFGTTNLNKLTAEQKAIATNKNWNLA